MDVQQVLDGKPQEDSIFAKVKTRLQSIQSAIKEADNMQTLDHFNASSPQKMHLEAENDKQELMNQLKSNFKFIEGFRNRNPIRDEKRALVNREWRVDSNIEKKIIKPTMVITTC